MRRTPSIDAKLLLQGRRNTKTLTLTRTLTLTLTQTGVLRKYKKELHIRFTKPRLKTVFYDYKNPNHNTNPNQNPDANANANVTPNPLCPLGSGDCAQNNPTEIPKIPIFAVHLCQEVACLWLLEFTLHQMQVLLYPFISVPGNQL